MSLFISWSSGTCCWQLSVFHKARFSHARALHAHSPKSLTIPIIIHVSVWPVVSMTIARHKKTQVYYYKKTSSSHIRNGKDDAHHDSRIQPRSPLSRQPDLRRHPNIPRWWARPSIYDATQQHYYSPRTSTWHKVWIGLISIRSLLRDRRRQIAPKIANNPS